MDINIYIESGILELYVAGALTEKENKEVYDAILKHPEVLQEVLEIEAAVIKLTASTSQKNNAHILQLIKEKLRFDNTGSTKDTKVISIAKPKYNWLTYTGWAAAILLAVGLFWTTNQNNQLQSDIQTVAIEKNNLEIQVAATEINLEDANATLNILRDRELTAVPLAGQGDYANSYAKVYWNKETKNLYLDAQGLPAPPPGKVYQVWSLKLSPLTPVSLGTIDNFSDNKNKIFEIPNDYDSEAFGITLEPTGGSQTPTMEQLYTLGVVETTS